MTLFRTFSLRSLRPALLLALVATSALLLGCDSNESDPEPERPTAELNLETLEAETEFGTLEAERIDASYVTALGEGQAIGLALLDESDPEADQEIVVSLYERGDLAVFSGELDSEGEATLKSIDRSDFDAGLEVAVGEEAATGTVTGLEEEATSFTGEAAAGVAGMYRAEGTEEDPDVSGSGGVFVIRRSTAPAARSPSEG